MLQSNQTPAATGEWECMECNHILEGTAEQRPARCPECNAGPEAFEFFSYGDEEWEGDTEEEDEEETDDELDEFEDFDDEDDEYDEDDELDDDQLDDDR
jgi:hypothetical protein